MVSVIEVRVNVFVDAHAWLELSGKSNQNVPPDDAPNDTIPVRVSDVPPFVQPGVLVMVSTPPVSENVAWTRVVLPADRFDVPADPGSPTAKPKYCPAGAVGIVVPLSHLRKSSAAAAESE